MKRILFFLMICNLYSVNGFSKITVSGISSGAFMANQMSTIYSDEISGVATIAGGFYFCAGNFLQDKIKESQRAGGLGQRSLYSYDFDSEGYASYLSAFGPLNFISGGSGSSASQFIIPSNINPIRQAVGICMSNPSKAESTQTTVLHKANEKLIADPKNLKTQRVFIYHGRNDSVVNFDMLKQLKDFYSNLGISESQIKIVTSDGNHNFPTDKTGHIDCNEEKVPYVASCGIDLAGDLLKFLTQVPNLQRSSLERKNIYKITQKINSLGRPKSVADYGYLAASQACLKNPSSCHLHVALHGCKMSDSYDSDFDERYTKAVSMGFPMMRTKSENQLNAVVFSLPYIEQRKDKFGLLKFVLNSGYADYVNENNLMVLFPQTWITEENYPYNPKGCWDWYGWTGREYATNQGVEAKWLMGLIHVIQKNPQGLIDSKGPNFSVSEGN